MIIDEEFFKSKIVLLKEKADYFENNSSMQAEILIKTNEEEEINKKTLLYLKKSLRIEQVRNDEIF